jgi:hypothetical protein
MMNDTAVPWPDTTRSTMPNATVHSQAETPAGHSRVAAGARRTSPGIARAAAQPITRPVRNGQVVEAMPASSSPLEWLARPIVTKASTQQKSKRAASHVAGLEERT